MIAQNIGLLSWSISHPTRTVVNDIRIVENADVAFVVRPGRSAG
jgi:hypothetical protein